MKLPSGALRGLLAPAKTARNFGTASVNASSVYTDPSRQHEPAVASSPENITQEQRDILNKALRVDQAGEVAANWIYRGQMAILGRDATTGPIIQVRLQGVWMKTTKLMHFTLGHVGPRKKAPYCYE